LGERRLKKFVLLQLVIASVFLSIVYADRLILDEVFHPYNLIPFIRFFHWVFFDVLGTVAFLAITLTYLIAEGRRGWKVALALMAEGLILIRFGMEDFLYYTLFQEAIPSKLPWLNYNPALLVTTVIVSSLGLELSVVLSMGMISLVWSLVWRNL